MTDQMTTSLFSILYGIMYQEDEVATNIQTGKEPLEISMKINPNIKTGAS